MKDFFLGNRKEQILRILINDYIYTCEPVGSHRIVSTYGMDVKSATVRNEMAELVEMGLLTQPHKSAGRIPSHMGYRVYVDNLMEKCTISDPVSHIIYDSLKQKSELEMVLRTACNLLGEMSGYLALASHPRINDSIINHISISKYGYNKLLLVIAMSNGYIIHQIIFMDIEKEIYSLESVVNYLSDNFIGKEIGFLQAEVPDEASVYFNISQIFFDTLNKEIKEQEDVKYYYDGIRSLLKLPEFLDISKLELILYILERPDVLNKFFKDIEKSDNISISIGDEIPIFELRECSVLSMPYRIKDKKSGVIAVIAPTRMDYSKTVAALEVSAKHLGLTLTNLSV